MSKRILLVEDETGLALTLTDCLCGEGYAVESAHDGESGLARARAESFDLLLLDVMLPRKNGFDLLRDLRQQGVLRSFRNRPTTSRSPARSPWR